MPSSFVRRPAQGHREVIFAGQWGIDKAGADHGDIDIFRRQADAQRFEQITQAGLGRAISFGAWHRQVGHGAGNAHQMRREPTRNSGRAASMQ